MTDFIKDFGKKCLSSQGLVAQVFGAILTLWWMLAAGIAAVVLSSWFSHQQVDNAGGNTEKTTEERVCNRPDSVIVVVASSWGGVHQQVVETNPAVCADKSPQPAVWSWCGLTGHRWSQLMRLIALFIFGLMIISGCRTLTNIFSLRKKETGITVCQIIILVVFGAWIIGTLAITNIAQHPEFATLLAILGAVLGWIFQDAIKGVAAFLHLRLNHLIHIDDWIKVPDSDVDGVVKRITLNTVTIYNWDTTTSSIPTYQLLSDHFQNFQNMMEGRTYGRRVFQTFVLDLGWIHRLDEAEARRLAARREVTECLAKEDIVEGALNINLLRKYIFHWMMKHPHVSQQPRLVVRWLEPKDEGLPLQVYAFITDSTLAAFELQQSQIIEHIVGALEWFGLRLYQSPSSYDVSNSNVYLTDHEATYRNEPLK